MNIFLKTEDEIELMRKANRLVGKTLGVISKHIRPGVTTLQLDKVAEEFIRDNGAIPTFKGFPNPYGSPFPSSICTSVNDVVVHGIPDDKTVLKEGDIISVDCGALLDGFNGDSCYTFCVGEVSPEIRQLLRVTKESLYKGIECAMAGRHVGDIGEAIQDYCQSYGYGVVRELTGHGIGRKKARNTPQRHHRSIGCAGCRRSVDVLLHRLASQRARSGAADARQLLRLGRRPTGPIDGKENPCRASHRRFRRRHMVLLHILRPLLPHDLATHARQCGRRLGRVDMGVGAHRRNVLSLPAKFVGRLLPADSSAFP